MAGFVFLLEHFHWPVHRYREQARSHRGSGATLNPHHPEQLWERACSR
ncbi:hypothetical protein [Pseudomonas sp. FG-3G]|nr:hypothetical protein [Pseudomonas sp. FG-3G]